MARIDEKVNSPENLKIQALLLGEVVRRILKKRADLTLSNKPVLEIKPIVEFAKRIRVNALGKFDGTTYVSSVNFYLDDADLEQDKPIGALIVYVHEDFIVKLLQKLNYPITDDEDFEALEDGCGTFCNLVAGNFKSGLTQLGFNELKMSHFSAFRNEIINGVPFSPFEKEMYELTFDIDGKKRIIVELTMGPIPRYFTPE